MALRLHDDYSDPGPIPAELMDDPLDELSDGERMIADAFTFATDSEVSVGQAIEMLADAEPERWRIVDDDGAEWALRKLAAAQVELDALRARATAWQERIEAWFSQAAREPAETAEFFTAHVEWYARQQRAEHDRKSFALPSGRVSSRSTAPCAAVGDEAAVLDWVSQSDDRAAVAPPQPRKVYVSELRKRTTVVEVIDRARLVLSDGEIIEWEREPLDSCPKVGDGWPTPETAEALVAQVEVIESHLAVVDESGAPVPGVVVQPEHVSVTVQAVTS